MSSITAPANVDTDISIKVIDAAPAVTAVLEAKIDAGVADAPKEPAVTFDEAMIKGPDASVVVIQAIKDPKGPNAAVEQGVDNDPSSPSKLPAVFEAKIDANAAASEVAPGVAAEQQVPAVGEAKAGADATSVADAEHKDEPAAPLSGGKRRADAEPESAAAPADVKKICTEGEPTAPEAPAAAAGKAEEGEVVTAPPPAAEPAAASKD